MERKTERSNRFRTPSLAEKSLGLWIDRVGAGTDRKPTLNYRLLGLYAAVFIEEGQGIFDSPLTGELPLRAGDAVLLFPETPARYQPSGQWRSRWIVWDGPEARAMESLRFFTPENPLVHGCTQVLQAHARLHELMRHDDRRAILERKLVLTEMLLELYDQTQLRTTTGVQPHLEQLVRDLRRHPETLLTVPEMAGCCGISESHFRRLFLELTGSSPLEFVTALRISKAKDLLAAGAGIAEIAAILGFRNQFYFMRVFKKTAGVSAGTWRCQALAGGL